MVCYAVNLRAEQAAAKAWRISRLWKEIIGASGVAMLLAQSYVGLNLVVGGRRGRRLQRVIRDKMEEAQELE